MMKKNLFRGIKLKEATFVFTFNPIPRIETHLAPDFAQKLKTIFEQDYSLTKVDDQAPPTIPRFILSSKNKRVLEVSLVNATFKGNYETLDFPNANAMYKKIATEIFNYLNNNKDIQIDALSLAFLLNYPLNDINYPIYNDIFGRFFKINKPTNLKEVSFSITEEKNDFITKTNIGHYQVRELDTRQVNLIKNQPLPQIYRIPVSQAGLKETGISLLYQVNSDIEIINRFPNKADLFRNLLDTTDTTNNYADLLLFGDLSQK